MSRPPRPEVPGFVITPEQFEMAKRLDEFKLEKRIMQYRHADELQELEKKRPECKDHVWRLPETAKYEWFNGHWMLDASVFCAICGKHGGWFCPVNPKLRCEYDEAEDPCGDSCIHCGAPDERK